MKALKVISIGYLVVIILKYACCCLFKGLNHILW